MLVESGQLLDLAAAGATVDEVGDELGTRLEGCVPDVVAIAAM